MPVTRWSVRWWIVANPTTAVIVTLCRFSGTQQSHTILNSSASLEVQLEFYFTNKIAIGLSSYLSLDVVSTKNWLFQLNLQKNVPKTFKNLNI